MFPKLVGSLPGIAPPVQTSADSRRPGALDKDLLGGSGANSFTVYCQSKLVNLLAAHWWRRQLTGQCTVVAVSPGLIPGTGLGRGGGMIPAGLPDAKTVPEGACRLTPHGPDQIIVTRH